MSSTLFHLAEFNVAKAMTPIDSPAMAEFVAQIAEVNAAAEAAPGFVWRLKSDADVVYPESLSDATLLVNMSVWVSVEDLYRYIYSGRHLEVFRDRSKWFGERQAPGLAAWWIPAGHIPNLEEAQARLEHLRKYGPTAAAFSLKKPFPPPAIRLKADAQPLYNGRIFVLQNNTSNGELNAPTEFRYRQAGSFVWATYSGGGIQTGTLIGSADSEGVLEGEYHYVNRSGWLRSGMCRIVPETLAEGRLRLHERRRWTDEGDTEGLSVLEEIPVPRTACVI